MHFASPHMMTIPEFIAKWRKVELKERSAAQEHFIDLTAEEMRRIATAAELDWSAVDPSIFGTLFERGLDPAKRAQLGAHFTGREDNQTLQPAPGLARRLSLHCCMVITRKCSVSHRYPTGLLAGVCMRFFDYNSFSNDYGKKLHGKKLHLTNGVGPRNDLVRD
jgi:hypothetical protein